MGAGNRIQFWHDNEGDDVYLYFCVATFPFAFTVRVGIWHRYLQIGLGDPYDKEER